MQSRVEGKGALGPRAEESWKKAKGCVQLKTCLTTRAVLRSRNPLASEGPTFLFPGVL